MNGGGNLPLVGVTGIEPAKSWSQTKRLTIGPHPEDRFYSVIITNVGLLVKGNFEKTVKSFLFLLTERAVCAIILYYKSVSQDGDGKTSLRIPSVRS